MDFTHLDFSVWFIIIISFLLSCAVLYFIIKWAVKNAIIEAKGSSDIMYTHTRTPDHSNDNKLSQHQRELKAKYERSEITLEEYRKEWNKTI